MIKAIIFDCFGVLVTESWTAFREKYFGHDEALMKHVTELSHRADAGLISHEEEIEATARLSGLTPAEVLRQIRQNVPNEPLLGYIARLKDKYKIGLLSNASANWLGDMFTPEQLALFDAIDLSFESGVAKPDPRAFVAMARKLGVSPEACVMVDDRDSHLDGARQAGMPTVLYEDFDRAKGDLEKLLADPKG